MIRTCPRWSMILMALVVVALTALPALAGQTRQNGTTLAASKTLDICKVSDVVWRYSGEVSVWNEGAIDTTGFAILDCLQSKTIVGGTQFADVACNPVDTGGVQIPAGTTQETALTFPYSFDADALPVDIYAIKNVANVTITNHSKHLGEPYGPSPKTSWTGGDPPLCSPGGGCTYTIGYWGTHQESWPAGYDPDAVFYLSPYTWGAILPNTNAGPNSSGYYQLARQYIGAVLNKANGAAVPASIQSLLDDSATFFATTDPGVSCNGPGSQSCPTQKTWAAVLDDYNNGVYEGGPGHCE